MGTSGRTIKLVAFKKFLGRATTRGRWEGLMIRFAKVINGPAPVPAAIQVAGTGNLLNHGRTRDSGHCRPTDG
jgi:hypothetical protein